jgi:hypothetical protein
VTFVLVVRRVRLAESRASRGHEYDGSSRGRYDFVRVYLSRMELKYSLYGVVDTGEQYLG